MKEERNYCVYIHIFPNGKRYIGITKLQPNRRWESGYGYHSQRFMYNAINKYGWNNIEHKILFNNLTKNEACWKEKFLIKYYNTNNRKFGYNRSIGGEINKEYKHTEEFKKRISKKLKGRKDSEETKLKKSIALKGRIIKKESIEKMKITKKKNYKKENHPNYGKYGKENPRSISVDQYDLLGNFIENFNSIKEASDKTGCSFHSISSCCKGKQFKSKDYIFRYKGDKFNKYIKNKYNIQFPIIQYDLNGNFIKEWESSLDIERCLKVPHHTVLKICRGEFKKSKGGYVFRYKGDNFNKYSLQRKNYKKVILDGIVYNTIRECEIMNGLGRNCLNTYLNGKNKMPKKWKDRGLAYYEENEN